jgi:hypothetical protein
MPLNKTRSFLIALAFAALSAGSAMASITPYTALGGAGGWASALTGGADAEALGFANNNLSLYGLTFATGYGAYNWGAATLIPDPSGNPNGKYAQGAPLTLTAPTGGTNALFMTLGADASVDSFSSQPLTITLTDVNGNATVIPLTTSSSLSNWGFTSGTAINTITISAPSGYNVDLADFYAGTFPNTGGTGQTGGTSSAPECATLLMVGGGLIVLGSRRKYLQPTFPQTS